MKPHMSEGLEIVLSSGSSDMGPEKHKGMGQLEQIICRLDAIEKKLNMKSEDKEEESEDHYDSVMYG
jgi:hypothetical protein|tara:strand:+ start:54 stop:254 length:201 start_codon:yes stop_codon:yes gene_type:complete